MTKSTSIEEIHAILVILFKKQTFQYIALDSNKFLRKMDLANPILPISTFFIMIAIWFECCTLSALSLLAYILYVGRKYTVLNANLWNPYRNILEKFLFVANSDESEINKIFSTPWQYSSDMPPRYLYSFHSKIANESFQIVSCEKLTHFGCEHKFNLASFLLSFWEHADMSAETDT